MTQPGKTACLEHVCFCDSFRKRSHVSTCVRPFFYVLMIMCMRNSASSAETE